MIRSSYLLAATLCGTILTACATSEDRPSFSPSELGTVGVLAVGAPPVAEALGPIGWTEEGARAGGVGFAVGAGGGAAAGALLGLLCGPLAPGCVPVFALTGAAGGGAAGLISGAVIGSVGALPEGTEERLETALASALADYDIRLELADRTYNEMIEESAMEANDLGLFVPTETNSLPDYQHFAAQDTGTVFEIGVTQVAFVRDEDIDTTFSLMINTHARLVDVSDEETLWANEQIVYLSMPTDVLTWTAVGRNHLKTEIENGLDELAQEIHRQFFVSP